MVPPTVTFGDVLCDVTGLSSSSAITCTTRKCEIGNKYDINITVPGYGQAEGSLPLVRCVALPEILFVEPSRGTIGSTITIHGVGFQNTSNSVMVGTSNYSNCELETVTPSDVATEPTVDGVLQPRIEYTFDSHAVTTMGNTMAHEDLATIPAQLRTTDGKAAVVINQGCVDGSQTSTGYLGGICDATCSINGYQIESGTVSGNAGGAVYRAYRFTKPQPVGNCHLVKLMAYLEVPDGYAIHLLRRMKGDHNGEWPDTHMKEYNPRGMLWMRNQWRLSGEQLVTQTPCEYEDKICESHFLAHGRRRRTAYGSRKGYVSDTPTLDGLTNSNLDILQIGNPSSSPPGEEGFVMFVAPRGTSTLRRLSDTASGSWIESSNLGYSLSVRQFKVPKTPFLSFLRPTATGHEGKVERYIGVQRSMSWGQEEGVIWSDQPWDNHVSRSGGVPSMRDGSPADSGGVYVTWLGRDLDSADTVTLYENYRGLRTDLQASSSYKYDPACGTLYAATSNNHNEIFLLTASGSGGNVYNLARGAVCTIIVNSLTGERIRTRRVLNTQMDNLNFVGRFSAGGTAKWDSESDTITTVVSQFYQEWGTTRQRGISIQWDAQTLQFTTSHMAAHSYQNGMVRADGDIATGSPFASGAKPSAYGWDISDQRPRGINIYAIRKGESVRKTPYVMKTKHESVSYNQACGQYYLPHIWTRCPWEDPGGCDSDCVKAKRQNPDLDAQNRTICDLFHYGSHYKDPYAWRHYCRRSNDNDIYSQTANPAIAEVEDGLIVFFLGEFPPFESMPWKTRPFDVGFLKLAKNLTTVFEGLPNEHPDYGNGKYVYYNMEAEEQIGENRGINTLSQFHRSQQYTPEQCPRKCRSCNCMMQQARHLKTYRLSNNEVLAVYEIWRSHDGDWAGSYVQSKFVVLDKNGVRKRPDWSPKHLLQFPMHDSGFVKDGKGVMYTGTPGGLLRYEYCVGNTCPGTGVNCSGVLNCRNCLWGQYCVDEYQNEQQYTNNSTKWQEWIDSVLAADQITKLKCSVRPTVAEPLGNKTITVSSGNSGLSSSLKQWNFVATVDTMTPSRAH